MKISVNGGSVAASKSYRGVSKLKRIIEKAWRQRRQMKEMRHQ